MAGGQENMNVGKDVAESGKGHGGEGREREKK